jgi:hypothetical protein
MQPATQNTRPIRLFLAFALLAVPPLWASHEEAISDDVRLGTALDFRQEREAKDSPDPEPRVLDQDGLVLLRQARGGELLEKGGLRIARLNGSPESLGHQHGALLKKETRAMVRRILYGAAIPATVARRQWFFGSLTDAWQRTSPHIAPHHIVEMDALAQSSGLHPGEIRLTQTFPELFHCSGFALFGEATADGAMLHGRILDYMTNAGLQQRAVVFAITPEDGYRWVNVGFAGFLGTVTAMNEHGLAVGEMGGASPGDWDGKPMSFLLREMMETCKTVDEAVAFLERTPRTCEFYYVISSGPDRQAVGIRATPEAVEVVRPGEAHRLLPRPAPDTVLMSAGDRYEHLAARVQSGYGTIDPMAGLGLMTRPVAMDSCLHAVLFRPESRELWIANASPDGQPATTQPYVHLTWEELFPLPRPGT